MKKFNPIDKFVVRSLSHSNSNRKLVARTKEDNKELSEVSSETFNNRKGNNPINCNDDIVPAMSGKRPVKPQKGMRKFKGSKSIRKEDALEAKTHEDRLIEEIEEDEPYNWYLDLEEDEDD